MAILTVRNVPDDVRRALRVRAARHGRSREAEVREIHAAAVKPEKFVRVGETLAAMRSHKAEIMRLMGEIEALVAEVQA